MNKRLSRKYRSDLLRNIEKKRFGWYGSFQNQGSFNIRKHKYNFYLRKSDGISCSKKTRQQFNDIHDKSRYNNRKFFSYILNIQVLKKLNGGVYIWGGSNYPFKSKF